MRQHEANARAIAEFLRGRRRSRPCTTRDSPIIRATRSRAADAWLRRHRDDRSRRRRRRGALPLRVDKLFSLGESLGGVESLIGYPWLMSHAAFAPEEKLRKGITEAVVRLSVGLEDGDDLCADLEAALARCR